MVAEVEVAVADCDVEVLVLKVEVVLVEAGQPTCSLWQHHAFFISDHSFSQLLRATLQSNAKWVTVTSVVVVLVPVDVDDVLVTEVSVDVVMEDVVTVCEVVVGQPS